MTTVGSGDPITTATEAELLVCLALTNETCTSLVEEAFDNFRRTGVPGPLTDAAWRNLRESVLEFGAGLRPQEAPEPLKLLEPDDLQYWIDAISRSTCRSGAVTTNLITVLGKHRKQYNLLRSLVASPRGDSGGGWSALLLKVETVLGFFGWLTDQAEANGIEVNVCPRLSVGRWLKPKEPSNGGSFPPEGVSGGEPARDPHVVVSFHAAPGKVLDAQFLREVAKRALNGLWQDSVAFRLKGARDGVWSILFLSLEEGALSRALTNPSAPDQPLSSEDHGGTEEQIVFAGDRIQDAKWILASLREVWGNDTGLQSLPGLTIELREIAPDQKGHIVARHSVVDHESKLHEALKDLMAHWAKKNRLNYERDEGLFRKAFLPVSYTCPETLELFPDLRMATERGITLPYALTFSRRKPGATGVLIEHCHCHLGGRAHGLVPRKRKRQLRPDSVPLLVDLACCTKSDCEHRDTLRGYHLPLCSASADDEEDQILWCRRAWKLAWLWRLRFAHGARR